MSEVTLSQVTGAILAGTFDEQISDIQFAIQSRKEFVKKNMMRQLIPGDVVRVDNIRPKAICGLTAKVNKVNRTTISVTFGPEAGRYAGPCKVPASCCEKVS